MDKGERQEQCARAINGELFRADTADKVRAERRRRDRRDQEQREASHLQ